MKTFLPAELQTTYNLQFLGEGKGIPDRAHGEYRIMRFVMREKCAALGAQKCARAWKEKYSITVSILRPLVSASPTAEIPIEERGLQSQVLLIIHFCPHSPRRSSS